MNDSIRTPYFQDNSSRYFEDVGSVSSYLFEPEIEHSFKLLLSCVSEHSLLMSISDIRLKYLQLIADSLESNKNITEISKGCVSLNGGIFYFYPVQSVSPKPIPGVNYCQRITKDILSDIVISASNDNASSKIDDSLIYASFYSNTNPSIYTLLPSEEIRSSLYEYASSLNLSKYIRSRLNQIHHISNQCVTQLTHRNLRLVMSVVKKEIGHLNDLDAIQEGNIGLLKGISRFQPLTGYKLTTYCTWWIQKYVKQSKYSHQLIKTPFNLREAYGKVHRFLQQNPNIVCSEDNLDTIAEATNLRKTQIREVFSKSSSVVYLDELESIESHSINDCDDSSSEELINSLLSQLPQKERIILSDFLTLSPDDRKRFLCSNTKKMLMDAVADLTR